jgi:NTP pyrophosphatase (non-canonical NTP hydrolase)
MGAGNFVGIGVSKMNYLDEMFAMQHELQTAHLKLGGYSHERGCNRLLWLLAEISEVVDIVKHNPPKLCAENGEIHNHLVEEFSDVMTYLIDAEQCYHITSQEFFNGYAKKYRRSMGRDFAVESKSDAKLLEDYTNAKNRNDHNGDD